MDQGFCVLVVDDDADTLRLLEILLSRHEFRVVQALDGQTGLRLAWQERPDAILLDIMMPGMDGFEVCRRLRQVTEAPILLVTALGDTSSLERGFALGADDYVVKPFEPQELISRLRATLRRPHSSDGRPVKAVFAGESVMLDCNRQQMVVEGRVTQLTPTEFKVIELLVRHPGTVFSVDAILTRVWGPDRIGDPDLVKHYVYQLRQKIEPQSECPRYLHTMHGRGYYFTA